jgi:hypothetical protein
MQRDFGASEAKYKADHNLEPSYKLTAKDLPVDFPVERARLYQLPWVVIVFAFSTAAYGFSLTFPAMTSQPAWIILPLVLQFFIAATSNTVSAFNQMLVVDLYPGRPAGATALYNLVRCSSAAGGVAYVELMVASVGVLATFSGLGLFAIACTLLPVINWYWGGKWRVEAYQRRLHMAQVEKSSLAKA